MSDQLACRITEREPERIRITESGTVERVLEDVSSPVIPPDWLRDVIRVRGSIGDPVTADFIFVDTLPAVMQPLTACTTGDGQYWFYRGGHWKPYALTFSDNYIRQMIEERGPLKAALRLIDNLIARIDPADYITSGNAGGQSVSFLTLAEVLDFYHRLRDLLLKEDAEEAGMNSGLMLKTKRRPVGGVLEEAEPWT
jgi:hypothetical protein